MTPDYPEIYFPHYRSEACLFSPHTRTVENGWVCGRHVHHTMLEILLVVEGTLTTILGCNEFSQQAGDIIIVSPMMVHDFQVRVSERVSFFTMHIHIEDTEILHRITSYNVCYTKLLRFCETLALPHPLSNNSDSRSNAAAFHSPHLRINMPPYSFNSSVQSNLYINFIKTDLT